MTHKIWERVVVLAAVSATTFIGQARAQSTDAFIDSIYNHALSERTGQTYPLLSNLCTTVGSRLSGSPEAAKAVEWGVRKMKELGFDTVYTQPVMVPHWVRGSGSAAVVNGKQRVPLRILALGGSVATTGKIKAEVIAINTWDELERRKAECKGRIVLLNRPMDPTLASTFSAYGRAVDQRSQGAIKCARHGAVAVLVRSMTTKHDAHPHTGQMRYVDSVVKIPSAALATEDADDLGKRIANGEKITVELEMTCQTLPDVLSYNVVGEMRGQSKDLLMVCGHLDSWDVGQGAHDDGAGCSHAMESVAMLKRLGYRPKHTLRAVLMMNEENGLRGGAAYADTAKARGEKHLLAIESDGGGHAPLSIGYSGEADPTLGLLQQACFEQRFRRNIAVETGGGGADISYLARAGVPVAGLEVESQRYFDYHHAETDVIGNVNRRELELGTAVLASVLYYLDKNLR